ncbi:MAG TPA: universal stress protein [Symbiobacteriaceae bacterium]|jgi:two-component system sensor histidine kinase KdpD|nr:universal stress protein [Symbiobacteriaceae bacterium]
MAQEEGRIDPEEALVRAREESRGKHRIYLGYAAGVGKTYNMLREGNRMRSQGIDVVIGILEHHNRKETIAQVGDLETVPRRSEPYKGVFLEEMDLDAIRERRPTWVLVDELAHTNVPGSRNQKRYHDVEELLEAGINVMSTVNIQHMESLNDVVGRITGVEIRETFPDWVLDEANEIIMVDITPELLQERLRQGKVYDLAKASQALKNFFRKGNLLALRELALRKTAEETDDRLGHYRKENQIEDPWHTVERVMVAITPLPGARALIRRGWRVASRLRGELYVLHIRNRDLSEEEERALKGHFQMAEELGAEGHEVRGTDVVEEIVRFAADNQISQVVMGAGRPSRWEEISKGSLIDRILRRTDSLDILIVSERRKA